MLKIESSEADVINDGNKDEDDTNCNKKIYHTK